MELEQQVVSLELAKKLKELGVEQVSAFYWSGDKKVFLGESSDVPLKLPHVSAFTVAELGEMLPQRTHTWKIANYWLGRVDGFEKHPVDIETSADTEADARAKLLIYLIENKLLPTND